jgi:hypothetical protein
VIGRSEQDPSTSSTPRNAPPPLVDLWLTKGDERRPEK